MRPTSRALCEMAKARLAWSRKNWIGSRRCSSRQGGRGRGPRTPAYSCGRERWRYCIACLSCTHFCRECRASRADEKLQTSQAQLSGVLSAASPSLAPRRPPLRAQKLENKIKAARASLHSSAVAHDHCTTRGAVYDAADAPSSLHQVLGAVAAVLSRFSGRSARGHRTYASRRRA